MRHKRTITLVFLVLFLVLGACAPSPTTPPDAEATVEIEPGIAPTLVPDDEEQARLAAVEQVEATVEAAEIVVIARGQLPDGCTTIAEVTQSVAGRTLTATITTSRDPLALCTEALVPFEEIIRFERESLSPGAVTVTVNNVSQTVAIVAGEARIDGRMEGRMAYVTGVGLPPNVEVALGVAPPETEYETMATTQTDSEGAFEVSFELSTPLEEGQSYVFVANVDGQEVLSEPFTAGVEDDLSMGATIYLIALEDGGQRGEEIGCGDSLVPVQVPAAQEPLRGAMQALLSTDGADYGDGLTNPLLSSDLTLAGAEVSDGVATIALEGDLRVGGVCDASRIEAQLVRTAAQFANVESVEVTINGEPLDAVLGGDGAGLPPAAVLEAQAWLAEQLGVPVEEVTLESAEQVEWSDSCLGLGGPAESCLAAITPGWQVFFTVDGEEYEVRTDETGQAIRSPQFP